MFCPIHCSAAMQHPRVFPGRQVFNPSDAETGIFQSDCVNIMAVDVQHFFVASQMQPEIEIA